MVPKERMILVSLSTTVLAFILYSWYVYSHYVQVKPEIINEFSFWGKAFLYMAPVMIVAQIIIHIVFAIVSRIVTQEDLPTTNDEMDRLIELKSLRISHWIFAIGTFLSVGSQAFKIQPWMLFIILIASGFLATVVSDITKIYLYKRGV